MRRNTAWHWQVKKITVQVYIFKKNLLFGSLTNILNNFKPTYRIDVALFAFNNNNLHYSMRNDSELCLLFNNLLFQ